MKTLKTILTIVLVALTTTVFGRIGEPEEECNCCPNEVVLEEDLSMESWMAEPFESDSIEVIVALEPWMSLPFEANFESELVLEYWMTIPFESSEDIGIEQWMAAAWI